MCCWRARSSGLSAVHIETLKTFCDLVDSGSFSKAVQQNLITQSAVSQQVRALEARYGQKLLIRGHPDGAVPTAPGKLLYAESKELLERFAKLEERLRERPQVMSGTVHVAPVYSVGLHVLPPHLKQFLKAHPQVNVRLEYRRTNEVYAACQSGVLQFGIVALPQRRARLEVVPLWHDQLVFVCSPEHRLARRRAVRLAELGGEPFIAFERDIPTRKAIDRILRVGRFCHSLAGRPWSRAWADAARGQGARSPGSAGGTGNGTGGGQQALELYRSSISCRRRGLSCAVEPLIRQFPRLDTHTAQTLLAPTAADESLPELATALATVAPKP